MKCQRCGGLVIRERYCCYEGACEYLRCLMCGSVDFGTVHDDMGDEEIEEFEELVVRRSYSEIGRALGISKQRVHTIHKRAVEKIRERSPEIAEGLDK